MDITYLDSQIRKKNRHLPSDYWYAHALTQKVHCVYSIDSQRAIVNVPACSCLLQKHLWHISCSSGIVRRLVKSLPLVCAGLEANIHSAARVKKAKGYCSRSEQVTGVVTPVVRFTRNYCRDRVYRLLFLICDPHIYRQTKRRIQSYN